MTEREIELPGLREHRRRQEEAKEAHEEDERRQRGRWTWSHGQRPAEATDLRSAVGIMLAEAIPCDSCLRGEQAPRIATRRVFGTAMAKHRETAEAFICDECGPPDSGPFRRYRWGAPVELPWAKAVRFLTSWLMKGDEELLDLLKTQAAGPR